MHDVYFMYIFIHFPPLSVLPSALILPLAGNQQESLFLFKVSSRKKSFFLAGLTATDFSRDFKSTDKIPKSE